MVPFMDARAPYVKFATLPVEDRQASLATGVYTTKDRDVILITPHGSNGKDELCEFYEDWCKKIQSQLGPIRPPGADGHTPVMVETRFPREWFELIQKGYVAWKQGEELPLQGTPLKQWAVLSPAQLQNCISNHILTIEQLAGATDEHIAPLGLGARQLRNAANAWLDLNIKDERNKLVQDMQKTKVANSELTAQVEAMRKQLAELTKMLPNMDPNAVMAKHVAAAGAFEQFAAVKRAELAP